MKQTKESIRQRNNRTWQLMRDREQEIVRKQRLLKAQSPRNRHGGDGTAVFNTQETSDPLLVSGALNLLLLLYKDKKAKGHLRVG